MGTFSRHRTGLGYFIESLQAEALRQWHKTRTAGRIVLEMSTGGGKTLIATLIAQSIMNETAGQVLYVCSTNQLIEQTNNRRINAG